MIEEIDFCNFPRLESILNLEVVGINRYQLSNILAQHLPIAIAFIVFWRIYQNATTLATLGRRK